MSWFLMMIACGGTDPSPEATTPAVEATEMPAATEPVEPVEKTPVEKTSVPAAEEPSGGSLSTGSGNSGKGGTGKAKPKEREATDDDGKKVGSAGPKSKRADNSSLEAAEPAKAISTGSTDEPAANQ
jgi:hypothetical protein